LGVAQPSVRILGRVQRSILDSDPDVVEVAPLPVTVPAQYVDLVGDLLWLRAEEVAGVGVLRHQAQRLALAAATDEDRRPGPADRPRPVQRLGELVVPALVGAVVVTPHLQADLQRLLKALEPFGDRRVRHAQPEVLALVPGGADTEDGAPL